ncbi:GNAT family N-acetyltransferase [Actinoalloteichus hymeniacidonis]|uniref:Acetyltransferase (GNAT) family protein n=1 Tax=Actinoalloteichus hymeniacidonis TaxID=340345 RepID=A0AAC9HQK0_9PSEU|nr:GNAT family N-acetyltransferase [Actinoalloteichus hymeniacidonis]AOS63543.1 acetyltransferase (GNAT) family protein [Actinoalloteichus hymeniacidonis]MBB5908411.1 ribosomal protein S18 acetylase RimI-like enzyme [Actinoalloteichus hymeniacidonis]
MTIVLATPGSDGLDAAVVALREWQSDAAPRQLHPGDVGWFWQLGAQATAAAVRTWSRDGRILAVGLLDGPGLLRITTAPETRRDRELARSVIADVIEPGRGVLPEGAVDVEAPPDALILDQLLEAGWVAGEPWTPLHRDLTEPVPPPAGRIEVVDADRVADRVEVQRAAFGGSSFTTQRWQAMAAGSLYRDARCLIAYADSGAAAAIVTVWSAGPGKPGLLEPLGVHPDHRRRGHGTAITVAAAAALRELGASSAFVCTPSGNLGAVPTYVSAGFQPHAEVRDAHRPG